MPQVPVHLPRTIQTIANLRPAQRRSSPSRPAGTRFGLHPVDSRLMSIGKWNMTCSSLVDIADGLQVSRPWKGTVIHLRPPLGGSAVRIQPPRTAPLNLQCSICSTPSPSPLVLGLSQSHMGQSCKPQSGSRACVHPPRASPATCRTTPTETETGNRFRPVFKDTHRVRDIHDIIETGTQTGTEFL